MTPTSIARDIKAKASELGFDACGFARVEEVDAAARQRYRTWLAAQRNGCMAWADRWHEVRDNPALLLDGARSIIMVAMNYYPARFQDPEAAQVAYYAYGQDYHVVMKARLNLLAAYMAGLTGCVSRPCVDSAPLRERYWAQHAGLGFIGCNHQLIIPGRGSYFFLGALVTTLELPSDEPCTLTCGDCHACLKACPGGALTTDEPLDARRCLSCLTIESRDPLPEWVSHVIGRRAYGCDTCQQCCPHNAHATPCTTPEFQPSEALLHLSAADIMAMTPAEFKRRFKHSAIMRTRLAGLQRNVAAWQEDNKVGLNATSVAK